MSRRRVGLLLVAVGLLDGSFPVARAADEKPAARPDKVAAAEAHRPTPLPDRVVLTWTGDPTHSQAVTWRTDTSVERAVAELAAAEAGSDFTKEAKRKVRQFPARTTPLTTNLGDAHYHTVTFDGLSPKTLYVYRVGDGANWSEWFQFRTAAAGPERFRFLYFGDAQVAIKQHWSRVIRQAFAAAPDARFMVHAGDLVNVANSDAEWGEWFQAGGWLHATVPAVPTPGNHEYYAEKRAGPTEPKEKKPAKGSLSRHWRPQFALPENGPPGLEGTVYYLDFQGVRLVSLNSNEGGPGSAVKERQVAWLERVLADNPNRWTVLTFHHPVFSTAKSRDNAELRRLWQPVFDKYGVDLVLQGHDHSYGRSGLVTAGSPGGAAPADARVGTVYAVSVSGPKMYELNVQDWMRRSAEGKQLYQVITVDGSTLRYEAHTATGELYDVFELHKRPDRGNDLLEREQLEAGPRLGGADWRPGLVAVAALVVVVGAALVVRRLRRKQGRERA